MPLGSALKSRIDIDFTRAQGINSSGRILFYPFRKAQGSTVISGEPVQVDVVDGIGSIELVRMGTAYYYAVREFIDTRPEFNFKFVLPDSAADVIRYETLAQVVPTLAMYTVVRSVNSIVPDPTTGNVVVPAGQGPKGDKGDKGDDGADGVDGQNGSNGLDGAKGDKGDKGDDGADGVDGVDGAPGRDGILKAFTRTLSTVEVWGPCGDSGSWAMCPAAYRSVPIPAAVGDHLLWSAPFLHQNTQEAAFDLASVISGAPARFLSTGTATPLGGGFAGLYIMNGNARSLSPTWFTVAAEDIDSNGKVTLALMYRNSGSGNTMGNAFVPGYVEVANAGPGGAL